MVNVNNLNSWPHSASYRSRGFVSISSNGLQTTMDEENITRAQFSGLPENRFLFGRLASLICESDAFKNNIAEVSEKSDIGNLRKKELLHKEWLNNVYYPLRGNIRSIVCKQRLESRNRRDVGQCQHHLSQSGVFIDDSKHCQATSSKTPLKPLKDPLTSEARRNHSEMCHFLNLHVLTEPCVCKCNRSFQ